MRVSEEKKKKISEQILYYLFLQTPKPIFTSYIAKEIARDEEFTKQLLLELRQKNLLIEIKKNKSGKVYKRRSRWRLSDSAYEYYKKNQF